MHGISNSLREKGHYHISRPVISKARAWKDWTWMLHIGKDLDKKDFALFLTQFSNFLPHLIPYYQL